MRHNTTVIADPHRFNAAIAAFDTANSADPNCERDGDAEHPKELVYARHMSMMLERFAPDAPEAVRLAVRCQHLRRWEIPRDAFPRGPDGYRAWRKRLMDFHAETAGRTLRDAGYEEETVAHVQSLLRKERLKRDPESQLVEDVVGLVFLEHYLERFVAEHLEYDEAKLADILRKTWAKMSPRGREAALSLVKLPEPLKPVILRAVGGPG
ncbi:MAG TPA: DUF4202 domain-containing protein [Burkholderiales bacterium]|nr:DUF4202 domain-containing protein [Burkholderiales bacterium]